MLVASASTTIKFHEFPSGNVIHNYQPGSKVEGPIRSISWSKDGNWLVLVPHSGVTEIVSVKDQLKLLKTISDIDEPTCAVFQNSTKRNIALGTKNGLVVIYDVKSHSTKKRFPRASSQITHLSFTSKDTHCVAGCKNGDVMVYSNITNSPPCNLRVPKSGSINCLKTSQVKRSIVLGGSNEGMVVVWDINTSKAKFTAEAHKAPVNSVAFSPVNSDLILTAGQDRQFCFYDIVDHKCIASVPVDNSVTAVDFSPDGTHFVTAFQNGRAYVYDSRNINDPVHSFQAHTSSVKHLAFRGLQESSNTSVCSLSTKSSTPVASSDDVNRNNRSSRNSDLFGLFVPTAAAYDSADDAKPPPAAALSMEGGDSFMAALGLDKNGSADSFRQEESGAFGRTRERLPSIADMPPTPSELMMGAGRKGGDKQFSSTPKFLGVSTQPEMSPQVRPINTNGNFIDRERIQEAAREAVKEELKSLVNDLKCDIKYQATHTTYQLRSVLLDMQMALVKEFIKLEDFFHQVKEELNPESRYENNNSLAEENEQLRRRNEFLEEQLRILKKGES
ncbi:unnamed protein product [Phaedon cochleariae]|uniref:Translation initiation factor beta propellor-like domain-containing protein n=1 Tax=Phaedon cochleariae TaxID=80249 RepID=A0A9N9SLH2_PHACE|nr:unnamed protein product [Phaedon cochleariae]